MSLEKALSAALKVAKELGVKPVVIGGLASVFWGSTRRTIDVDLQIAISKNSLNDLIGKALLSGFKFKEPIMVGLRFSYDNIDVDFLVATTPLEKIIIKTSVSCNILGISAKCANINELIASKWLAGRPKDLQVINQLLLKHADKIDRKYINKLVPDKPFYLEPDASPKKLKQASIEELKYLAKTNKKLSSKIYKVIDIIEKFYF